MGLTIDGKTVEVRVDTLGGLIQRLGSLPEYRGRVIQSVTIDGIPVENWHEELSTPISPENEVIIETISPIMMLVETAFTCKDYLARLAQGSVDISIQIHQGLHNEAIHALKDLTEGLQWYNEFLSQVVSWHPEEQPLIHDRATALNDILNRLVAALEEKDLTLLADLLEYELAPELERGIECIDLLTSTLLTKLGN